MPKILIIRFSSIGDIVLTSPVIRCLHQQLGAEVHFLTKKSFRGILQANPYVSKIYTIDRKVTEVLPQLKAENYDYVVDLHKNLRSFHLKLALRKPSFTFDKLNWQKWLLVNFKIDRLPRVHIVDRYMAGVALLGVQYDGGGLDYFIPPAEEVDLNDFFQNTLLPNWSSGYLAIAIGATYATKRLPVKKIIDIARQVTYPMVLLGGPEDKMTGEAIANAVGPQVLNACGQLSLHQSASLIRQAAQVLSHDTGLMHIAAAFGKPIVSVWGNTIPELGMYPFYPEGIDRNATVEVKGLSCRPCSKIGSDQCPKKHFNCMNHLDLAAVVTKING